MIYTTANGSAKLRGAEQDGKYLDGLLVACQEGAKRLAFQAVVDRYGGRLYQLSVLTKMWDVMEHKCLQYKYDTEHRCVCM